MDIETVMKTEARLLAPICTFEEYDGYTLYRSEKFPNFYGGNGISIHDPGGRSLAGWEEIFRHHFDPARFVHTAMVFPHHPIFEPLMEQARERGYNVVETIAYMFLDNTRHCVPLPEGYEIRRVESEDDWEKMAGFAEESYTDGDWYDPDRAKEPDRLFEKLRFTTDAIDIEWFYIAGKGSGEMLAHLGIFRHAGICRLQDVATAAAHRRKGLASALVSYAGRYAIETLGTAGLALIADSGYHAIDLYRKVGFVTCGQSVELMSYPVRNPLYLNRDASPA